MQQLNIFEQREPEPWEIMRDRLAQAPQQLATANCNAPQCSTKGQKRTNNKLADKFETLADKMQSQIDGKLGDRQENTPKRMAQGASARVDGYRLQRTQDALRALATRHRAGTVPAELADLASKKAIHDLLGSELSHVANGFHTYYVETGKPRIDTPQAKALWTLTADITEEEKHAQTLAQAVRNLQFSQIPGYFPTPDALIDRMLDYADIQITDVILEPSAGSGAILAKLPEHTAAVAFEVNHSLCGILKLRGYDCAPTNFMNLRAPASPLVHKILMNPPFEKLQDIDHVLHAWNWLKPGGRLVAIMSPGPFFRSDKKCTAFQAWIAEQTSEVIDLPPGTFKESGTGVASKLVIIDKE